MPQPAVTEIWVHGACAPGGYGGWSYLLGDGEGWRGAAGGATRTDAPAMVLGALLAALEVASPQAGGLVLQLPTPGLLVASDTHVELHARIAKALARWPSAPRVVDARAAARAGAWSGFLGSWADFARDKAKSRGAFSAAIPRLNIAKFVQDAI